MKIVEKSIDEIYPYENNPRFNERAVEPLDLENEKPLKKQKQKVYTCPKCGFIFEVAE